jgi:hypothetical protein
MLTPEARLLIDVRLAQRVLAMMFMVAQSRFFTWLILNPMPRVMWRWPRSHCRLVLLAMFCFLAGGEFLLLFGAWFTPTTVGGLHSLVLHVTIFWTVMVLYGSHRPEQLGYSIYCGAALILEGLDSLAGLEDWLVAKLRGWARWA